MKVIVQQETLSKLLNKGAFAALTDQAQGDTTTIAPLIQSVKITAGKEFTIESAINSIIAKATVPADTEHGVEVKQEGSVVILAKDLTEWVANQKESKVGIVLAPLDVPEAVASKSEDLESKEKEVVRKTGTVKVSSKDNSNTGSKWQLDAYDVTQLPKPKLGENLVKLFEISPKALKGVIDCLSVSAQKDDHNLVYDSIAIQKTKNGIYAATTDTKRMTIYKLDSIVESVGPFFDADTAKILIHLKELIATVKIVDENEKITIEYDAERNSILMTQNGLSVRLGVPEKGVYSKFPNLDRLLEKKYCELGSVSRNSLVSRMFTASLVNKETALFLFANDEVKVYARTEGGKAPSTTTCAVNGLKNEFRGVWGVQHLIDLCKLMKDELLLIEVPDADIGSYKIASKENPNLIFYGMSAKNSAYDEVKSVE
jgi:DNA polymerase III sliding clamp (beta) subunit (PCNA family)